MLLYSCCLFFVSIELPPLNSLYKEHLRFSSLSQEEQNTELMFWLSNAWNSEQLEFDHFRLNGFDTCESCFRTFYGVSAATWNRRKKDHSKGRRSWEHGNTGHGTRFTEKGLSSRAWMTDYFFTLGDYQPDTGKIHLPPSDKQDVFNEMQMDLGDLSVELRTFYEIWKDDFPEVLIPAKQRLGKCEVCSTCHERILSERDKLEREKIKEERRVHMKQVKADRLEYHRYRKLGRERPQDYTVVIIDGMDQDKTCLPNFNSGENLAALTVRIIGAICHGPIKKPYAYLITDYTKETNTVLEILRRVLEDQPQFGKTLVLQLDNTSQENKNSHMFSFLSELVESKVFERVIVNFLPVGHTHVSF